MYRRIACLVSTVFLLCLMFSLADAQTFRYDFDGTPDDPNYASDPNNLPYDPTDWMTVVNWWDNGFDPDPNGAFGPPLPDFDTRVEIQRTLFGVNAPVIGPGDAAKAFGVRIGRHGGDDPNADGTGLLTMTGGTLDLADKCNIAPFNCSRLRVGNADVVDPNHRFPGTFNLSGGTVTTDTLWIGSGSHGEMHMSGGEVTTRRDFTLDWTSDLTYNTNSLLNMTAGTINVGTTLRLHRLSSLNLEGGEIFVSGAARLGTEFGLNENFLQTPDVTVTITDGLLRANGFLQIGGSITLDGGILRANRFDEVLSIGTIDINADGILQFDNSQESVAAVEALIAGGTITTSEASPLTVGIVDVDGTDFTQVSFAAACGDGDFDCNGIVDGLDFLKWQRDDGSAASLALWEANYATPLVAAVASVPEPSSAALVMLMSVFMALGRRNLRGEIKGTNQSS